MTTARIKFLSPLLGAFVFALAISPALLLSATASHGVMAPKAPASPRPELERRFNRTVRPFLLAYCVGCHGKESPKAQLDLSAFDSLAAAASDYAHWALVLEKLAAKQMPPPEAGQPPDAQREAVIAWVRALRQDLAERNAGDPGDVPARRLSNAEYDYTIEDLTGVDLRPTREFPVDPANPEGFDNSGESLTVSPALMKKYLRAARGIADHLVLKPAGFDFAPHPMLAETDRDKYCILRIVDFYRRQPTDYAEYFLAAWRYRHRTALGAPRATLQQVAAQQKLSHRYLELVWRTLNDPAEEVGPIARLQAMWNALPPPASGRQDLASGGGAARSALERGGLTPLSEGVVLDSKGQVTAKAVSSHRTPKRFAPVARQTALTAIQPRLGAIEPDPVRKDCEAMRDFVVNLRRKLAWKFTNLNLPRGFSPGGQCFILWKDRQYASHRRSLYPEALQPGGVPKSRVVIPATEFGGVKSPQMVVDPVDPDLFVPQEEAARAPYLAAFERFCSVFPDTFYVAERGRMHIEDPGDKGRLLSAGFHNMMGYFRDDTPLKALILDEQGRKELDRLWLEFDFVAFVPERMHLEFIFYERAEAHTITTPEFDFARSEDKDATSEAKIRRLGEVYLAKARTRLAASGGDPTMLPAIEEHFRITSANIRAIERARAAAEATHLAALLDFARRAYRRPLTAAERDSLSAFYQTLREKEGLSHEDAIRDLVVSVLMSPNFLFRVDLRAEGAALSGRREEWRSGSVRTGSSTPPLSHSPTQPLPATALASRLSYFLWSSLPDEELLARAAAGDLSRPEGLAAQARRMLRDPRARRLAVEFGGNWLDFRRFEEHNAVDRERFPAFDDALRRSMFEEPVRFLTDTFQQDRSVLELLYGKHTFVNAPLARHYGMDDVKVPQDGWSRVESADRYGRGGLLPMAVFLTANSPGLRTSPVKRGYWVVRRVLGERIPPPPPVVPELPHDERQLGDQTLRQVLERHRANPACAGCHARFDSFGLVFENYGPVGELRSKDLGGKPVDTRAPFPGGSERTGLSGLRDFLRDQRQDAFLDNFCRKLLAYALGRSLLPSDDPLLAQMRQRLAAGGYRFGTLVESIVTSRQFRTRRAEPIPPPAATGAARSSPTPRRRT